MVSSANEAVQNMIASRAADRETLKEILSFLERHRATFGGSAEEAFNSVKDYASAQTPHTKNALIASLSRIARGGALAVTIGDQLAHLIELASRLA